MRFVVIFIPAKYSNFSILFMNNKNNFFSVNSNFVDHELIAGFEWNLHDTQIDLTWFVHLLYKFNLKLSIILIVQSYFGKSVPLNSLWQGG